MDVESIGADLMRARLERRSLLELFCISRQSARSVDALLMAQTMWQDFQLFYDDSRRHAIRNVISILDNVLRGASGDSTGIGPIAIGWREIVVPLYRRAISVLRDHPTLNTRDLRFIHRCLLQFEELLAERHRPPIFRLTRMRCDLSACDCIVEDYIWNMEELEKARHIEQFLHPYDCESFTLSDILAAYDERVVRQ